MKTPPIKKVLGLILFCSLLINLEAMSQEKERRANLQGTWRFTLGDNKKFSKPEYDDSDWERIVVPSSWQEEGFRNYNGYAWYRKTFEIDMESKDVLYLELGRIDDVDETYFNGHLIGSTGGFPPDYFTAYNYGRRYVIPMEYINKGKNVIAVRVYDEGGEGGLVGSTVGIYNYRNYSENSLHLFGKWKFHLSDNPEWSEAAFNDSSWENIIVPSNWETQGFQDYDGFAWYRKTFKLPSNFNQEDLMLLLGKIDDMDEVFINGTHIGGTGNLDKKWADDGEWEKYRTYAVPDDILQPGKDNVIAVRTFDQEGRGGIYEGPITLLPRSEYKQFWRKYRDENYDFFQWVSYYFFEN